MAGHFILRSITQSDRNTATTFGGITWSALAHAGGSPRPNGGVFPGWTPASRAVLTAALNSQAIPNRDDLPPHRYLQIAPYPSLPNASQAYVRGAGWASNLIRPNGAGLGLRALTPAAQARWDAGDKEGALLAQCQTGAVSVEIYYMGGIEMS